MVSLLVFLVFREEIVEEVSRVLFCPPYSHHCRRPGAVSFLPRKYISHSYHGPMRRDLRDSVRSCPLFIAFPAQTRYQYVIKARTKPRWTGVGRGGSLGQPKHFLHIPPLSWGSPRAGTMCVRSWRCPQRGGCSTATRTRQGIVADVAQERTRQCSRASRRRKLVRRVAARPLPTRTCSAVRPSVFLRGGDQPPTHPAALLGLAKFAFWGQGRSVDFCFLRPAAASSVGKGQTHGVGLLSLRGGFHRFIPIRTLHPLLCLVCPYIRTVQYIPSLHT